MSDLNINRLAELGRVVSENIALRQQLAECIHERDELLAALELLDDAYSESEEFPTLGMAKKELSRRWKLARAAIAKGRERQRAKVGADETGEVK
jgi:hypothetical protein